MTARAPELPSEAAICAAELELFGSNNRMVDALRAAYAVDLAHLREPQPSDALKQAWERIAEGFYPFLHSALEIGEDLSNDAAREHANHMLDSAFRDLSAAYESSVAHLRAQLGEAREALRPFAKWAARDDYNEDDFRIVDGVTWGDLRRAAEVLAGDATPTEGQT